MKIAPLPNHLPWGCALNTVVSRATLANTTRAFNLHESRDRRPPFATVPEWQIRHREGLVVRL